MINNLTLKDEKLNYMLEKSIANIAQFVSFKPGDEININYICKRDFIYKNNQTFVDIIMCLIDSSPSGTVNIRSFSSQTMKGNKIIMNKSIKELNEIINIIKSNTINGKYSIINENIDINDGGVSGVVLGNIIEFAPEDTPKCVDKEGVCSLPRHIGMYILEKIYGFKPEINFEYDYRVEFSIHPSRQGVNNENTIIWEYEKLSQFNNKPTISWPNKFSKFIGDKVFGLLVADSLGLKVPKTTVISRNLAPFVFGTETGLFEKWIRTSPILKAPGKYYTSDKWTDPFILMNTEEAKGDKEINIASILSQDAIEAKFSGASIVGKDFDNDIIEGVVGKGEHFMIGEQDVYNLPEKVLREVKRVHSKIRGYYRYLGNVSIEWVYDGKDVWIVQMNQLKISSKKNIIVEGNPVEYIEYDVKKGLEGLRNVISDIEGKNIGIELVGNIGITSHFGDLFRLSAIPSKLISYNE